jgi:carbon monoxide dehydrogenase subunit G
MLIEDSFTVRTPVDRLWTLLQDVQRIAPCLPGAELTETIDERTWRGVVHVRFGPVQLAFRGTVMMEERDDTAHRATLSAKGTEQRGKGAATATVESWLEPAEDGATTVHLRSQITLTGPAAQLSRGLLPEVSRLLTGQFAGCLQEMLETDTGAPSVEAEAEAEPAPAATPRAVEGFGLGLRALWNAITRFVRRLFGRRTR